MKDSENTDIKMTVVMNMLNKRKQCSLSSLWSVELIVAVSDNDCDFTISAEAN